MATNSLATIVARRETTCQQGRGQGSRDRGMDQDAAR
jgi:hypothetical protein